MRTLLFTMVVGSVALGVGCARRPAPRAITASAREDEARSTSLPDRGDTWSARERAVQWPAALMVDEHAGPTLHRRSGRSAGYAWIEAGVAVRLTGAVRDGRARAIVDGPLRLRGWIDVDALSGVVRERGRVEGSPVYVVPGDALTIRSVNGDRAEVSVAARFGHPALARSSAFVGTIPLSQLGAGEAGGGEGATAGERRLIRQPAGLYLDPHEDPVFELPALDPPLSAVVLRERGEWVGVRVGIGPYLVGYVRRDAFEAPRRKQERTSLIHPEVLNPWERQDHSELHVPEGFDRPLDPSCPEPPASLATLVAPVPGEPSQMLPDRLAQARVRAVWEIPRGTRVRVEGAVVAVFDEPGVGVEMYRTESHAVILGAVDEGAAVQGEVALRALRRQVTTVAAPPAPSPD